MINKTNLIKAFVISLILSLIMSIGSTLIYSSGRTMSPDMDWGKINTMSFKDATEYIDSKSVKMTKWETVTAFFRPPFITKGFLLLVLCIFIGCVSLLYWVKNEAKT